MTAAAVVSAVGAGAVSSGTATNTISVTPHANVLPLDLIVLVVYMTGDPVETPPPVDEGDGWMVLDFGYDSSASFGIFLAVCIARKAGASGYNGLSISESVTYSARTYAYRVRQPYYFSLAGACGSGDWFSAAASATAAQVPAIAIAAQRGLDILGRGHSNAAALTAHAAISGFKERVDTGTTSPPIGICISERAIEGSASGAAKTSNLSVAKAQRAGVRGFVPIVAGVSMINRHHRGGYRRVG